MVKIQYVNSVYKTIGMLATHILTHTLFG